MLHAHAFVAAHQVGKRAFADSVVLTFEDRRRRRGTVTTLGGLDILVDLREAPALGHGDAYELEDGRLVEIVAEAEPLLEVKGRDPAHLVVTFLKEAPDPKRVKALQAAITGPEVVRTVGTQAYITYPNGIGRSRVTMALIERTLGTRGTGRNWNTVLKLGALAAAQ